MSAYEKLKESINSKRTYLCVGLDTDISKMPEGFEKSVRGMIDFNRFIVEATSNLASAYKINFAFYERYGMEGYSAIKQTLDFIPKDIFTIADAKRGDIGNTSQAYADSAFDYFGADSITVSPYMGSDSLQPFFEREDKLVFVLALTSNKGSFDYQRLIAGGKELYKVVIEKTSEDYRFNQIGYVVGATHPEELSEIRSLLPNHALLIPGVGAQGGDISAILNANNNAVASINVSRAILYPSGEGNFRDNIINAAEFYSKSLNI